MSVFLADLRFALRLLLRRPGASLLVVLVIALGIGANTAIFSVVNGVLWRAFSYEDPDRLVVVWEDASARGGFNRLPASPGNFLDWRRANLPFSEMAGLRNFSLRFTDREEPLVPLVHRVTPNYFDLLGVQPSPGRGFLPEEAQEGRDRVVVLSHGIWRSAYGADPDLLGRTVELDGLDYVVVGVMPPDFHSVNLFPVQPGIWIPLSLEGEEGQRQRRDVIVLGRLSADTSLEQAQSAATSLAANLSLEHPQTNQGWSIRLEPVIEDVVGGFRQVFGLLWAAVGFLLLLACANIANIILTRVSERSRELALRTALGAGKVRLTRQLLTESLLLALTGGLTGIALAGWGIGPILRLIPSGAGVPFLDEIGIDLRVLAFTLLLTLATGVFFGLIPAWQAGRRQVMTSIRESGKGGASISGTRTLYRSLVVCQVAISMVLLAGAGLTVRSFNALIQYEPGFEVEQVLTLRNSVRGGAFQAPAQRIAHFEELSRRLEALPGAVSASGVSFPPPLGRALGIQMKIEGQSYPPGQEPSVAVRVVLSGYFETMGIPVVEGRSLGSFDRPDSLPVAVVNRALARLYLSGKDPLGSLATLDSEPGVRRQIVGVVGDVRSLGMSPEPTPAIYIPHTQSPLPIMNLVVRSAGDPKGLLRLAEREAWGMNDSGNVYAIETFSNRISEDLWTSRLTSLLLSGFALMALVLGVSGIYAVLSSFVASRSQEIGVRVAMGARRKDIHRMVLGEGLFLSAIGLGVGLAATWALSGLISGQLYGVSSTDPATIAAVAAVLLGTSLAACLAPSIRATRVDPIRALQAQ